MAHIVEFKVEGLAGRKDAYAQKLDRHINIFFGPNGSGKTSLLKILHSAMSSDSSILRKTPFRSAEVKVYSVDYDTVFTRTINQDEDQKGGPSSTKRFYGGPSPEEITFHEYQLDFLRSRGPDWVTRPKKGSKVTRWHHQYLPTSRLWLTPQTLPTTKPGAFQTEEQLDLNFQSGLESLWLSYMQDVLGKVRQAQAEGLTNILKWILAPERRHLKKEDSLDANTAYERVNSFLIRQNSKEILGPKEAFHKRYSRTSVLRNVVSYIDEVELSIEDAMSPRNRLESLIASMFTGNKKVLFSDKSIDIFLEDKKKIEAALLSSGEKQILRILVEVLHGKESSILIDEPEISMHVDWQRDLVSAMRMVNSEAQLILATHSPEIMAEIDDDNIFRM